MANGNFFKYTLDSAAGAYLAKINLSYFNNQKIAPKRLEKVEVNKYFLLKNNIAST